MAGDEGRVSKRSRFDQTEEPKRSSRFDRRSRSPVEKDRDAQRERSTPADETSAAPTPAARPDAAAIAAAAAARINASIQAKRGVQHVDVPPIRESQSPAGVNSPAPKAGPSTNNINGEVYIADGDYIKDIEVNDLRNRYTLTKGSTQKMIKEETGADVTTRGSYYPDKSMATAVNPPLYLHITSTTKVGLDKAVEKINEMMQQELPNLVDERRFRRREPEQQVERDEFGRRKWPEERIPIDLEPIPGFNLRAQVVGHGGSYVKHIQGETRCRVQIKGRNSGFIEHGTNAESDEPMYLHVAGPDAGDVQRAKELCLSLLENVAEQYQRFKDNPPQRGGYDNHHNQHGGGHGHSYGGYGHGHSGQSGPPGQQYQQHSHYQHQQHPYQGNAGYGGGVRSPAADSFAPPGAGSPDTGAPSAAAAGAAGSAAMGAGNGDYAAQYAQYYGGQDPYAAYGGYQNYVAYYQYYQQQAAQQQQQQGQQGQTDNSESSGQGQNSNVPSAPGGPGGPGGENMAGSVPPPPPPPPADSTTPSAPGSYNSVPPPPGM